jgi:hypothetical protein
MINHLSKLSMILIGFVGGVSFLIGCGGGDSSTANAADPVAKDYYLVDAANVTVGRLLSMSPSTLATISNDAGYLVSVTATGAIHADYTQMYYESSDCTGQAYTNAEKFDGRVIGSEPLSGAPITYVPIGASEVGLTYNSTSTNVVLGCNSISGTADVLPLYLNDPSVTGVPDAGFTGRMQIKLL